MTISDWPINEQPREKLLKKGPESLSDAEILSIFLRTGREGASAIDLARELLIKYRNLRQLIEIDQNEFCQIKGLGVVKYVQIQAAIELGKRYLQTGLENGQTFTNPEQTREFITLKLRAYPNEIFACLYLDNHHRLIGFEKHFSGTIDSTQVHAREIIRTALKHNAAALIFAHNHPSGIAEPSQADIDLTRELKKTLALIDVRVLDHFIIGDSGAVSFAERGLI
ncbi:MAG: DNA repair protein RadC [Proteobacteria bacterium]|nr:DNA repair protein RadC [Pseudomonadota bacterium]